MSGIEPGDRRLDRAPSERYGAVSGDGRPNAGRSSLRGPLLRSATVAVVGAVLLILIGGVFASEAGLLFVAGGMGAAVGLVLARAAVPGPDGGPALTRRATTWLAVSLAIGSIAVGAVGTWLFGRTEGGTLGVIDYLWTTFGLLVPAEAAVAALAAWWGAGAGPVQG